METVTVETKENPFSLYLDCLRPSVITPKLEVDNLLRISLFSLMKRGIKGLIFDVDNTLGVYHANAPDERFKYVFRNIKDRFNCCILSNTSEYRKSQLESFFGIPAVGVGTRKPQQAAFKAALDYLKLEPNQVAMVGDRLLTDIAGANRMGIYSIKVKPVNWRSEPLQHSVMRGLESAVLAFYRE